jgi:hypothetical protein
VKRLVVALVALLVLAGCSSASDRSVAELASSFPVSKEKGAERILEGYRKTGTLTRSVKIAEPEEMVLAFNIDCVGDKGVVEVRVGDTVATADCPKDGKNITTRIGAHGLDHETKLTVTPKGSDLTWSTAVDLYEAAYDD